jgi:PAS domain-containing protein
MNIDSADYCAVKCTDRLTDDPINSALNLPNKCEIWLYSDGRLLGVSLALERLIGFTHYECLKIPDFPLPLIERRDRERMRNVMKRAVDEGIAQNDFIFQLRHRDGTFHGCSISVLAVHDKPGDN